MEPVDLLLYNNANRDLQWKGSALEGKWVDTLNAGSKLKVFEIEKWPGYHHKHSVPEEVLAAVNQIWPGQTP
jgi:hypothetical protein